VFRNSELGGRLNKAVEMINYAPHPLVEDVRMLPGGVAVQVLAESLESDAGLPEAAQRAFRACVQRLGRGPEAPAEEGGLGALIRLFAQLSGVFAICSRNGESTGIPSTACRRTAGGSPRVRGVSTRS
jgi:hypothetical protein